MNPDDEAGWMLRMTGSGTRPDTDKIIKLMQADHIYWWTSSVSDAGKCIVCGVSNSDYIKDGEVCRHCLLAALVHRVLTLIDQDEIDDAVEVLNRILDTPL